MEENSQYSESPDPTNLQGHMLSGIILGKPLGHGGMGTVYKAFHTRLCIPVAIKVMSGKPKSEEHTQFMNEARLGAKVNHPNVARVYDVNDEGQIFYIVQEFVEGESVAELLDKTIAKNEFFSEARALEIAMDVARGLVAIHRENIVHLDIKPANILLQWRDGLAKIVDLGMAHFKERFIPASGKAPETSEFIFGTPGFMSPEQILGLPLGPTADIYALGSTLYELLTTKPAFESTFNLLDTFQEQVSGIPRDPRGFGCKCTDETADIVLNCLQANPLNRFESASVLLEKLIGAYARLNTGMTLDVSKGSAGFKVESPSKVVCVDDDHHVREMVEDVLTEAGHKVYGFAGGELALRHLESERADIVLLDYEMPGMNGLDVCRAIRATPLCHDIPVVFVSGVKDLKVIESAISLGAIDYLFKPISPPDLLARVQCLTRLSRIQNERNALIDQYHGLNKRFPKPSDAKDFVRPARILLAENDPEVRGVIVEFLQQKGATVVVVDTGADALNRSSTALFDLCILDIQLPVLGGFDVCKCLRAMPFTNSLPIVFISGDCDFKIWVQAMSYRGTDFVVKPVNTIVLWHRIEILLNTVRRAHDVQRMRAVLDCV